MCQESPESGQPKPVAISLHEQLLGGIEGVETERAAALIRYKADVLQARERLSGRSGMVAYWVKHASLEHASQAEAILPFSNDELQLITFVWSQPDRHVREPLRQRSNAMIIDDTTDILASACFNAHTTR